MEYILLLLIVLMITLAALYQFNSAFANFAKNYFGEYLACLLETGDLPNLGAPTSAPCDAEFEPFDLASGRQKRMPEGKKTDVEKEVAAVKPPAAGAREQGVVRRGAPSRFRASGSTRVASSASTGDGGATKGPSLSVSDDSFSSRNRSLANAGTGVQKLPSRAIVGDGGVDADKKEKVQEKKSADEDSAKAGREGRLEVKKVRKEIKEEEGEPMTFGKFIKYLLIAGIIIAIVIFLGGQVLQISKEWD